MFRLLYRRMHTYTFVLFFSSTVCSHRCRWWPRLDWYWIYVKIVVHIVLLPYVFLSPFCIFFIYKLNPILLRIHYHLLHLATAIDVFFFLLLFGVYNVTEHSICIHRLMIDRDRLYHNSFFFNINNNFFCLIWSFILHILNYHDWTTFYFILFVFSF